MRGKKNNLIKQRTSQGTIPTPVIHPINCLLKTKDYQGGIETIKIELVDQHLYLLITNGEKSGFFILTEKEVRKIKKCLLKRQTYSREHARGSSMLIMNFADPAATDPQGSRACLFY